MDTVLVKAADISDALPLWTDYTLQVRTVTVGNMDRQTDTRADGRTGLFPHQFFLGLFGSGPVGHDPLIHEVSRSHITTHYSR